MSNSKYRGVGSLPKFLVDKIGKDAVQQAVAQGALSFNPDLITLKITSKIPMKPKRDFIPGTTISECSNASLKAHRKYRAIKEGKLPPDKLYPVDEALAMAGFE